MERAVQELAPSAADWLERTRRRYPEADRDALARLAAWDYGRMARRRAIATGSAQFVGPIAATGPLTRLRIEVVLVIAAVNGRAARHLARDLVALLQLRTPRAAIAPVVGLAARALAARVIPFGGAVVAAVQARAIEDVAARAHGYYKGQIPET
jgi:hypothetical protein